jgi:hypothetical protein
LEVEAGVAAVEALIWEYNDATESARAAWLRENLSREDNERLLLQTMPHTLGLP